MSKAGIIAGRAVIVVDIRDLVTKSLKGIQNQLRQFSRNVSRMAVNMTLFGGASSTGSLLLTKQFTQFEDSMLFLQSKLKTTDEVFKSVTETIRNLGRTTSFTAQEVAEGGVFLAQAGFAADEIQDMLQAVLDLARGTRTELPTAARILSNALRTYGIEAKESTKVVSQFLIATDSGTLDLVALSESMKEVQGTFKSFNVSIETSMAFITMLASRSLRGTKAGTSLNAAFLNLASSADKIKKTFNIDVADAWGNLRDPIEIMKELKTATQRMGNVKRTDLFRQLFNIRGGRTIEPIFSQIDQLALLQRRLQMASDEARRAALLMDSSWGGSVRRATSALQDLNITIQDIFTKSFKPLMDLVPGFSNAFEQLAKANERLTLAIILTPPAVLLLGVGFLIASTFASKFALILGVVNAALMGASRGVLALAGAPLNVLSQGLAAATMQGRKFDIMLGSLIPDRYVRGKKKGMPKPTSFMGKLSTKSIPIVAPLESFVRTLVGGLTTAGKAAGGATKAIYGMIPAWIEVRASILNSINVLDDFTYPLRTAIRNALYRIGDAALTSMRAIDELAHSAGKLGVSLSSKVATGFKRIEPFLSANWFPEFGSSGGKSFLISWANFEKDVINGTKTIKSAIQTNLVKFLPKINLGANLFPNFGATPTRSLNQAFALFQKDLANLARPLNFVLKPFQMIGASLQGISTRMSQVATATINWVNKIEAAKDAWAGLTTAQKIKGVSAIGGTLGKGMMGGLGSIGTMFSSMFKAIPFAKITSGAKVALTVIGKGFLGLWNIVKKIDIVRILYNVITSLKNILRTIVMVTGGVLRFAMSWNGLFLALDILILFGDKIPVINTSLSNLGKAFSNAFSQIGQIGKLIGPAFKLIQDGIIGLRMGQTDAFDMITRGVANIIGIIQTQLFNAWAAFVNAITDEIAFVYRTFMSIYEVIMLIVKSLGTMTGEIGRLFSSLTGTGDIDLGATIRERLGFYAREAVLMIGNMIEGLSLAFLDVYQSAFEGIANLIKMMMDGANKTRDLFREILKWVLPNLGYSQTEVQMILGPKATLSMDKFLDESVDNMRKSSDKMRMGIIQGSEEFKNNIKEIFDTDFTIEFAIPPKIDILDYDQTAQSIINPDQDLIDALEQPGWLDQAEQVFKSFKEGFVGATTGSFGATRNTLLKTQTLEEKQTDFMEQIANNTAQLAQNW